MVVNKSLSLQDEIRRMSKPQLEMELRIVRHHIDYLSFGRFQLVYENLLFAELDRRGVDIPEWKDEE
jgi:hypothetical protein